MTTTGPPAHRLYVMGRRELLSPDGRRVGSVLAQPKRLCLLTYLAMSARPVPRSTLAALFWPESDEARARNALSQAVHYLRKSLGPDVIEGVEGDLLRVPPELLWCDACAFLEGIDTSAEAVAAAHRDVLEGWNADDSQPLQEWLDSLRREVSGRAASLEAAASSDATVAPVPSGPVPLAPVSAAFEAPAPVPPAPEAPAPRLRAVPWARVAIGVVALAALAIGIGAARQLVGVGRSDAATVSDARGGPPSAGPNTGPNGGLPAVVLLEPVLNGPGSLPASLAEAIRIRIAAELAGLPGVVASTASERARTASDARRELEAIGEPVEGKWFLTVLTTVDGTDAEVTILLGDGGRNYPATYRSLSFADRDALLVEGPRRIARHVAQSVRARLPELTGAGRDGGRRSVGERSPGVAPGGH